MTPSVDGNERTQATEAEVTSEPAIPEEKNLETHSSPTENGSDLPVPSIGEYPCPSDNAKHYFQFHPS